MSLVTTLWSMQAAAALTLAVLYAVVWSIDRRNLANLTLCVVAVAMAVAARDEVGMMHAATTAEYGEWARLIYVPIFFALIGLLLFVQLFLGTGRRWLLWTIVGARVVIVVGNFLTYPTFSWQEILTLRHVSFLGEPVALAGTTVLRSWHWLSLASCALIIVFIADAVLRAWGRGGAEGRRKALVVAVGVGLPLIITIVYAEAVLLGASLPLLVTPAFLITFLIMAVELSRGFLLTRQTRQELEELRSELARAGRVTALGQLASALAHELSQPLSAILRNAEAAEIHLNNPAPDLDELREIVADIRRDDRRAGDVIEQMRALIKRRTLQMHPRAQRGGGGCDLAGALRCPGAARGARLRHDARAADGCGRPGASLPGTAQPHHQRHGCDTDLPGEQQAGGDRGAAPRGGQGRGGGHRLRPGPAARSHRQGV
jgi:signal transduction histidine kinase